MDCKSCRDAQYVPRITHETDMSILKKETDWLRHCVVVVAILLLASWMFFFWYRDQYMCEITEISVQQDSDEMGGINYFYGNGGGQYKGYQTALYRNCHGYTDYHYPDQALGAEKEIKNLSYAVGKLL